MDKKRRLLLINTVCGVGSTGRICEQIAGEYEENGYEVRIAYGRSSGNNKNQSEIQYGYRIGDDKDVKFHGLLTRAFDLHGFGSKKPTRLFLRWIEQYDPDVIWLHNIHGYYIHVGELFEWIKNRQIMQKQNGLPVMQIRWTLHDCWSFTGHCAHFSFVGCDKWKTGCGNCPQKKEYPGTYLIDRSYRNWNEKRSLFTGVMNMTIITPSQWLANLVKMSFLREYPIEVKHNTVDYSVFKPTRSDFREQYGLTGKIMILGVSSIWNKRKGLDDFIALSGRLDENSYHLVLVGVTEKQKSKLDNTGILCITHVESQKRLAEIYSAADVFVNFSREESFGLTTLEAISCGTKVLVYEDTACEEVVKEYGGVAVPRNLDNVISTITELVKQ